MYAWKVLLPNPTANETINIKIHAIDKYAK